METQRSFIVSDLHLGSPYFYADNFLYWLDRLPPGDTLILNGDTIDAPGQALSDDHEAVLKRLVQESYCRPLIWVYGNHDKSFRASETGKIRFVESWTIGQRLLVVHGDNFDQIMPRYALLKDGFKYMHRALVKLGMPDVHVAYFAKKWNFLYRVLNGHVARKALKTAKHEGYEAVTCGHTHASMDIEEAGVRYINTGAWTEKPHYYIEVDEEKIVLHTFEGLP